VIFTHLKMTGFKSFAEPEHISIEDGMTGVVGPNGCGKSNIVESLRWLMGESSAKSMRGGELEDIIFAGSSSRPSRNFAEVTLTLDNSSRKGSAAQFDSDDLEITRRIERGKGSSFKINGKSVRARDVQLLFADMATGSRSSGIVSQGKVGALISAKPVDRRNLLEEAANIRGLHQRRHEAELRLNTAENNLERLADILVQLDEQKASLVKQARQATRYRSIADRIRKADAHLMLARFTAGLGRLDETETLLREAERLTAAAAEDAAAKTRLRHSAMEKLPPLRQNEAEKAAQLQRLTLERDALQEEERRLQKSLEDAQSRLEQITTDTAREHQLLNDAENALAQLTEERQHLDADDAADQPKLENAARLLAEARDAANEAERALADASAKSRAAEREAETTARQISDLKSRQQQAETALAALDLDGLTTAAKDAAQARDEAEKHATTCRQALTEATTALEKAQSQAEAASSQANEKSTLLARINAEKDALDALLTPQDESASPISSSVKVKNGYEQALAAALGDALTAPMGKSSSAYWLEDAIAAQATCPQGTTPLADHLDLPPALTAALSGVGVVEDASAAEAAQKTLAPGQAITTIDGGLWRWDGYVQPLGAETSAAMRLKQEARLRELTAEFTAAEQEAETALEASTSSKATLDAAREALQNHRQAERQAEQDLSQALRRDESARTALETAEKRRDELSETLSMLSSGLTEAEAELSTLADPAALVAEAERLRIEAEACRQTLAETMGSERTIRNARDQRQTRRDAITRETDIWAERQKGAHARIDELASRKGQAEHDAQTLANQPQVIAERRHALGDAIDKAEAERREAGDVLAEAETELAQADAAQRDADQALSQQREGYIRCESQRDLAKQDLESITNRIRERLNASPDALRELAEMNPDDAIDCDDDTIANLEQRHERLIRERENIGPVNLRAEAEMQEVDERIASINTECDDLNAAISKLRSAISQLNREGRERLLKSFTEVNRYFETLFKSLFNGGSAELKLTEADDPLDAGLEILASPPGKKLQSLSLLSGGEQALTALALIFAVFLTNPSPICILDEVDAPLDDTNVARFCDMLSQIAQETGTRFIVVTHHRLTMAKMDRLYGVTMEQKGVSRIVSVDLQAAERFKESA
jgi:chromosome segregation protein